MEEKVSKAQMGKLPYIIAVDFDGTLVTDAFPEIGEVRTHVWSDMLRAKAQGAMLILWTCRDGINLDAAVAFCKAKGVIFDAVNTNIRQTKELFSNDTRKVYANEYWDDKAIKHYCVSSVTEHQRPEDFTPIRVRRESNEALGCLE